MNQRLIRVDQNGQSWTVSDNPRKFDLDDALQKGWTRTTDEVFSCGESIFFFIYERQLSADHVNRPELETGNPA